MLNICAIQGRLTRDPELTTTASGTNIGKFSLACEEDYARDGKRESTFIDFVAFGKTAEFVCKHFKKGDMALANGRLKVGSYTDKEGVKRKSADIIVSSVNFCGSKRDRQDQDAGSSSYTGFVPNSIAQGDFATLDDDDAQLPF